MAARFYLLVFVVMSGLFGMVWQPNMPFVTAQAQTIQDRKAEVDKLNELGSQQLDRREFKEALQTFQHVLDIHKETKNHLGEGTALNNIGTIYRKL